MPEETITMLNNAEDEVLDGTETITEIPTESENTSVYIVLPAAESSSVGSDPATEDEETILYSEEVTVEMPQLLSTNVSTEKITSSDTSGLKSVMLDIIGDYETVITDYTYSNGSYTSHSIDVQPDYVWITCLGLFAMCIWCTLKIMSISLRGNGRRRY